jgi:dipeptidyl aminopeptidase/acylaminoacyl peptidase
VRWLSDNEIAYTLENIGKPASIQSFNFDSKKYTDWTKERLPAQLADKVKSPEVIRWKSFDQKEITGYVVRPKAATSKKSPVLVYVHGGPQILDKPLFNTTDISLAANLNMTTIHTNIRGSSGFGKEFIDADNREKRGDAVKTFKLCLTGSVSNRTWMQIRFTFAESATAALSCFQPRCKSLRESRA